MHQAQTAVDLPTPTLQAGLSLEEVHARLHAGARLQDAGSRVLAFYLVEMETRRLHQRTGHSSTVQFAEARLDLDRRRTRECIAVGKALLDLPAIDEAFCAGRIGWAKLLHLVRVATPEHEAAWLERARTLSCRALALEVRLSKPGAPPRKPGDRKGLPEVRFPLSMNLRTLAHRKFELAKEKLAAERGAAITDAECLEAVTEVFLQLKEDGTVDGRARVAASMYQVVVREEANGSGLLVADTEAGPVPLSKSESECIRCDASHVGESATSVKDAPTPPALRRRVLARDGHQCRACGSRAGLMVHHIRYRSQGGPTKAWNLITLCTSCHALVHDDLLVIEGRTADGARFTSAAGEPVSEGTSIRTAPILHKSAERSALLPNDTLSDSPRPQSREEAFDGIAGQDSLLDRLVDTERGVRARGRPFPHTLLVGPPGTGKTTLSRGIAALIGARFHTTCGPLLAQPGALDALLDGVGQGDVVFVDEVHAVPRPVLEVLYESMDAGRFTLLAATTEEGDLPDPLHSRFGLVEALTFFAVEDLASIVQACAEREGFVVASEAALRIAGAARGTPREALRLAERAMDEAAAARRRTLGALQVEATLTRLGFDRDGLNPTERRYLRLLRSCRGPTPLARIARMLGLNCRTLLRHVEPFLFTRGLVRVTPRGRVAV